MAVVERQHLEQPFTHSELRARHAYLLRFRRRQLVGIVELAQERLEHLGWDRRAWEVLHVFNQGRAFTYDVAAAEAALGPDLVSDAERGRVYSEAWLAAEAACLADEALACIELDDNAERLDRAALQHGRALQGDERARRELEAARPLIATWRKHRVATRQGAAERARPFVEARRQLYQLWRASGRSHNAFCHQLDGKEPMGIRPHIVGYENLKKHLTKAKDENRGL